MFSLVSPGIGTSTQLQGDRRPGRKRFVGLFAGVAAVFIAAPPLVAIDNPTSDIFINEVHYDNVGTDAGEFVEIAGPAGIDLAGWTLVLYNGNGGTVYTTTPLVGVIPDLGDRAGVLAFTYPPNGIQNGSPDGMALVDAGGSVVQFLSYEGTIIAVGGPADGLTSTEFGVVESGTTPVGTSMQLIGNGSVYGDFTWVTRVADSPGALNTGQNLVGPPPPTTVPPTTVPPTTVPPTTVPPTTVPPTTVPPTTVPPATAPPTTNELAPPGASTTTAVATTVPIGGTLPATGTSSSWSLGVLSLAALLAGVGFVRFARRP